MAADDHRAWNLGDDTVAADDSRPDAVAEDGDRAARRLDPVYVRLREILHRTQRGLKRGAVADAAGHGGVLIGALQRCRDPSRTRGDRPRRARRPLHGAAACRRGPDGGPLPAARRAHTLVHDLARQAAVQVLRLRRRRRRAESGPAQGGPRLPGRARVPCAARRSAARGRGSRRPSTPRASRARARCRSIAQPRSTPRICAPRDRRQRRRPPSTWPPAASTRRPASSSRSGSRPPRAQPCSTPPKRRDSR